MSQWTLDDAWLGGSFDALMYFGLGDVETAVAIGRAVFSADGITGPYRRHDCEPEDQPLADFSGFNDAGCEPLLGQMCLFNGVWVPMKLCAVRDDDGLWVYCGPTMGGLVEPLGVGAYPLDDGKPLKWIEPLTRQLLGIVEHVHKLVPMRAAAFGWCNVSVCDLILDATEGRIAGKRWWGLAVFEGNHCRYLPPTENTALMRPE